MMWYTPWWAETGSLTVGCRCVIEDGHGESWTRAPDGTFLHQCGYPSIATIRSQDMLNLFRYGPHHNELIETTDLTTRRDVAAWIVEYDWTPEKVIGSLTGREARVWVHKQAKSEFTDS